MGESNFTATDLEGFREQGFVIARGVLELPQVSRLREQVEAAVRAHPQPLELESEVGYPGAPANQSAPGGHTPRRLLNAFARGGALADWARDPRLLARLRRLLDSRELLLCQAHHNCVMTKYPQHSSDTGWHQDLRYWAFNGAPLVNSWLALGREYPHNGGLSVIPGSHRWQVAAERLDPALFLRPEDPQNAAPIAAARAVELAPGDVLFFNAGLFHSATRNRSDQLKVSVVFTYHSPRVSPRVGTKSAALPEVPL